MMIIQLRARPPPTSDATVSHHIYSDIINGGKRMDEIEKAQRRRYKLGEPVVAIGKVESFIADDLETPPDNWIVDSRWRNGAILIENPPLHLGDPWFSNRPNHFRVLERISLDPISCIMLGWTTRYVGEIYGTVRPYGEDEGEPGYIDIETRYLVYTVQPISRDNRYRKPIVVLPEQLLSGMELEEWMKKNATVKPEGLDARSLQTMSLIHSLMD